MKNLVTKIIIIALLSVPKFVNAQCTIIPSDIETSIRTTVQRFYSQNQIDIEEEFNHLWVKYNIENVYDTAVKNAINSVSSQYHFPQKYITPFSKKKLKEYIDRILYKVENDPDLNAAFDSLNTEMSIWVSRKINQKIQLTSTGALYCLLKYLKQNAGDAIAGAFINFVSPQTQENIPHILTMIGNEDISNSVNRYMLMNLSPLLAVPAVSVATKSAKTIIMKIIPNRASETAVEMAEETGIGESAGMIARTVGKEAEKEAAGSIMKRIARRIAIDVFTPKAIGVAIIAVTTGLLVYDLYKLPKKVDNEIFNKLTSIEAITAIRDSALSKWNSALADIPADLDKQIADSLVNLWKEFQANYSNLLTMVENYPEIKNYLSTIPVDKLQLVSELSGRMTEPKFVEAFETGALNNLINLPEKYQKPALVIAEDLNDVGLAVEWINKAGPAIDTVISKQLYLYIAPQNASLHLIKKLSSLPQESIKKLANYDPKIVEDVVNLIPPDILPTIIDSIPSDGLTQIIQLASQIDPTSRAALFSMLQNKTSKWENIKRISSDILKATPAKRIDLIKLALSDNPVVVVKKALNNPGTAVKLATHRKVIGATYILMGILGILALLLVLNLVKILISLVRSLVKPIK